MSKHSITYTGNVEWVLEGSCGEPGSNAFFDLSPESKQPPILAGFESASPLPEGLTEEELHAAPENPRLQACCGEMLCVNGWCFIRPTDKKETFWPYKSLAVTRRMICPGGIFIGPPGATPTYTITPADIPKSGMSIADLMDIVPSILSKAGIPPDSYDGAMVVGFADLTQGNFSAICKSPIYREDLRDPRNDGEYKCTHQTPAACRCFLTGAIITNHHGPCPNLHHAVYDGSSGLVGGQQPSSSSSPKTGASTHIHCLQLAADSPLCARPLRDLAPADLG
eukprot:CAMPEP_0113685182 /NCGR_PEP_ID=MMETSP0038_2-20120614/14504_1 /TAXON_ID=2898 /ORGANISM="Cryptomonas paramecium" /LENGTH=280 /DNA_ID=CAMNT_0000605189 /DNA_START=52 /DNA_END=890 /DNA_ORIENTATION=- /assembly_acc=CAM_ASM_000170